MNLRADPLFFRIFVTTLMFTIRLKPLSCDLCPPTFRLDSDSCISWGVALVSRPSYDFFQSFSSPRLG